jgi:hypothetical protein
MDQYLEAMEKVKIVDLVTAGSGGWQIKLSIAGIVADFPMSK